ncbi:MAG: hypothetical protein EBS06_05455 [Proteobacteria bacterium]|nr:hypothetical protein [Pseudomonadota bacterium]
MAIAAVAAAGVAGAGAAYLGSQNQPKNLTSSSAYTPFQADYLNYGFDQAKQNYQMPLSYYPGQTYASPSDATISGLQKQQDRATNGNPLLPAAQAQNLATINGDYLNSNPYLQQAIDNASVGVTRNYLNTVAPGIQSQFSGSGRYGSGALNAVQDNSRYDLASNLSQLAGNLSYTNYNQERQNQLAAVNNAPALANADYTDIASLLDVGKQREAITQQGIDDSINRYNFAQNEPNQRLATYMGLINGNYGGTTTTTERNPAYKTAASALAGGALQGIGLGSSLVGSYGNYQNQQAQANYYNRQ